ncbi:SGNH/GDSL hydrolase family protein [Bacillus sp. CGMCC 1.16607]|uniref:SGNH/GDSL hydrolase family protein n=1 Tax=Bacillus sp. CGMCC 1.16607 TaxID=3351842 RepID=UPI003632DBC3
MQGKKTMLMITIILIGSIFIYIFFLNHNQTKYVTIETKSASINEPIENETEDTTAKKEEQLEVVEDNDKPIAEKIKEKVREVLDDVLVVFKKDQRIVSIGDSLTLGIGDETESGGYVGILNHTFEDKNLNITIENYGKRGNRTDQLLDRLEKKEITSSIKKADIVLITIGANDIMKVAKNNWTNLNMKPFEAERVEYTERLRSIFNKINEINPEVDIYLIGFYNPFEFYFSDIEQLGIIMESWNESSKLVTEEFENVNYIPIQDLFSHTQEDLLAEDRFHPNTKGYKLMAKRILEYLEELSKNTEITTEDLE